MSISLSDRLSVDLAAMRRGDGSSAAAQQLRGRIQLGALILGGCDEAIGRIGQDVKKRRATFG